MMARRYSFNQANFKCFETKSAQSRPSYLGYLMDPQLQDPPAVCNVVLDSAKPALYHEFSRKNRPATRELMASGR
jgi:hypothetical protein